MLCNNVLPSPAIPLFTSYFRTIFRPVELVFIYVTLREMTLANVVLLSWVVHGMSIEITNLFSKNLPFSNLAIFLKITDAILLLINILWRRLG